MDRIAALAEILEQSPNDAFARYGLAMEYANSDRLEQAMAEFGKLLTAHPDYTAGYFMAAQALAKAARIDEAKSCSMMALVPPTAPAISMLCLRCRPCSTNWDRGFLCRAGALARHPRYNPLVANRT